MTMKVIFRRSFLKDFRRVDKSLGRRVEQVIEEVEQATSSQDIHNLKRLSGKGPYYRIRIGDYRIGLKMDGDVVEFLRLLHRKDMYRYFP